MGVSSGAYRSAHVVTSRAVGQPRETPLFVELVGVAGVGKTHLKQQLGALLGDRCLDLVGLRLSYRDASSLPAAWRRAAPLGWFVMTASKGQPLPVRAMVAKGLLRYGWASAAAARQPHPPRFVLAEGWFHKLRRVRKLVGPETTFLHLPLSVRSRLGMPDLVLLVTADPMVICQRKLKRAGEAVTPEALERQYARSGARGLWDEDRLTRIDLQQAASETGLRFVEIDYGPEYDVAGELVPLLESFRMKAERSSIATSTGAS